MARHGNPPGAPGTHGPPSDDALSNYDQVLDHGTKIYSLEILQVISKQTRRLSET